jgi:thiopeptide-type bacteriocin biosynthesis protein
VPRFVYLCFHDNRLLLDLEDEAQVDELRREVRRLEAGARLALEEALPGPDDAWVPGPGGRFIAELVVPLVARGRPEPMPARTRRAAGLESHAASRLRPPGTEWLFAKVYAPAVLEEEVLIGSGAALFQEATAAGLVENWFFIRYSDPDPHLRLRFRGDPRRLIAELVPRLCDWGADLVRRGVCSRLCLDTYDRELERYGGPEGMAAAEDIFGADSRAVVRVLGVLAQGLLALDRISLAVLSIDDLLDSLGASEDERLAWCREVLGSRRLAGPEYRARKATLRDLLGHPGALGRQPGGAALAGILGARRQELSAVGPRLAALGRDGALSQPRSALHRSYVHMHCNRLLGRDGTAEEQVLALLERTRYGLKQAPP